MITIRINTSEGVKNVEAADIMAVREYNHYRSLQLSKPISVDGAVMPDAAYYDFGENAVVIIDDNHTYNGLAYLNMENGYGEIRCYEAENQMPMLMSASDALGDPIDLNDISGGVGPFVYSINVHLDTDDFTKSYFAISLSAMGVKLCNAHLDINNPKISFGTSVCGVGAKGTLGVDFDGGRIYIEGELSYVFGTKKFSYDLYNWKNYSVQFIPAAKNKNMVCAVSASADNMGGRISIENRGAYVAKFTVAYTVDGNRTTKESDNFSAGVTKSIEIPAGATNIQLCAQDAWFFGSWNDIFSKSFDTPVTKKYRVSGTTLNTSYEEISV